MRSFPFSADFIRSVHAAPGKLVLAVTGGGSLAISGLLETAGASRSVLEAHVPYAPEALVRWLQARPEQFCSEATARAMAMAAYLRAREHASHEPGVPLGGIGCTASLASDRPKQGAHRIHAALQTAELTLSNSLELTKDERTRREEEVVAAALVLNLVAEFKRLAGRLDLGLLRGEAISQARATAPAAWQDLLHGKVCLAAAKGASGDDLADRVVFAGAFHPRHAGHREMARLAAELTRRRVDYELSIFNVDKPPLDYLELERRARQFADDERLWFTCAPTFVQKAQIFPRATFVVGADTIARIAEPKYYGGEEARAAAFARLACSGCRFLVFGRGHDDGFRALCDLNLPQALVQLCAEVPAEAFRMDISSTALRTSEASGSAGVACP